MNRTLALAVAILTASAALAGCTGGDSSGTDAGPAPDNGTSEAPDGGNPSPSENEDESRETEPADAGPNVTVEWYNGSAQGQNVPTLGPTCFAPLCDNVFALQVPNGTVGLVAEMAWDRSTSLSLDLDVPDDVCETGDDNDCQPDAVTGQSPVVIRLEDAEAVPPGDWEVEIYAEDSPLEPTEFTIAVGLFEGGPPPADYAKLADR